jgi:hypothetical protein
MNLAKLEDRAIALMRQAATGRLPVDVGFTAQLADVVRYAYRAGEQNMAQVVQSAMEEYLKAQQGDLGRGELELLRDAFGELAEAVK